MIIGRMNQPLDMERKTYHRSEAAWFFSSKDPHWSLSNMASGLPIRYAGETWNSSEALYQACKYPPHATCIPATGKKNNIIPYVRKRILTATTPMASKMTQRCAVKAGLVRRDWADPVKERRIHAMLWSLEQKLICNEIFKEALLATGDFPIVEISRRDDFWGCIPVDDDRVTGRNILGQLLMDLRERIDDVLDGQESYPHGLLLK